MLNIMENDSKIFVAWLDKYVRKDKMMYGKKLAELIGVSPPTITGYCDGRTEPSFEKKQLIIEKTGVPYKKIMEEGHRILRIKQKEKNLIAHDIEHGAPYHEELNKAFPSIPGKSHLDDLKELLYDIWGLITPEQADILTGFFQRLYIGEDFSTDLGKKESKFRDIEKENENLKEQLELSIKEQMALTKRLLDLQDKIIEGHEKMEKNNDIVKPTHHKATNKPNFTSSQKLSNG